MRDVSFAPCLEAQTAVLGYLKTFGACRAALDRPDTAGYAVVRGARRRRRWVLVI